jgi:hypothetical protein
VFRAHAAGECNSPVCYLQTRYGQGEWPLEEVKAFEVRETNLFRQSLLTLTESSDDLLASTAVLVVLAVMNNDCADQSLLREMNLLPYRLRNPHHHHHKTSAAAEAASHNAEGNDDGDTRESSVSSVSSSHAETEESPSDGTVEIGGDEGTKLHAKDLSQSSQLLVDGVLRQLTRSTDVRLLSTQLNVRLLLDLVWDDHQDLAQSGVGTSRQQQLNDRLSTDQRNALVAVHSVCTHQVMQSMRGAMADVDLFVYVLEDELGDFDKARFPIALPVKSSSPFDFLVPLLSTNAETSDSDNKKTLDVRHPVNEMEACRKAMRTFLILRRLRGLVDSQYRDDGIDELITWRHPHTALLAAVPPRRVTVNESDAVDLSGMVLLPCVWREQRFLATPARLLLVVNPEALAFVERASIDDGDVTMTDRGFVRLFAPVHRVYASFDGKDELVVHFTIASAVAVEGCRSYRKSPPKDNAGGRGALRNWHVSVLFGSPDDARQAKANIDLCRAEVRAFKLLKIEEALSAHVQITSSRGNSARDSVASSVDDIADIPLVLPRLDEHTSEHGSEA